MRRRNAVYVCVLLIGVVNIGIGVWAWKSRSRAQSVDVPSLSKRLMPLEGTEVMAAGVATEYAKKGKFSDAKSLYESVLQEEPENVSVLNNLGFVLMELGMLSEARQRFQSAISLREGCLECLNNMGSLLFKEGKTEDAQAYFERALIIQPDFVDALLNLAVVAEKFSDIRRASQWYAKAQPLLKEPELKKWVSLRILWLNEVKDPNTRALASP